ncbi:MAG TPA: oligoendopeptidase F [Candidatus Krumholzibacteria bacterium]|nr:oligoendopeptidase F [Candidatus Krumholzibacteria bacterium]
MPRRIVAYLLFLLPLLAAAAAPAADLPAYTPDANASRDQVPDVYKWDLTPLFADVAAWEAELVAVDAALPGLAAYQGKLKDPQALAGCLDLYFSLHDRASRVAQYTNLALDTNLTDQELQARQQRSLGLMDRVTAASGFIRGELLALDAKAMDKAYRHQDVAKYKPYIENLRRRASRILSADGERALQLAGDNLWAEIDLNEIPSGYEDAFGALLSDIAWPVVHDAEGREVQMTLSNYGRFRASPDRKVRAEAVTAFLETLRRFQHAFAATLGGQFELDVTYARARGYDTALAAYLDKDDIPVAVHDNLIAAVNANLDPLHRYVELRRKALGLDSLHLYDLYVPMVAAAEKDVPFPQAIEILPDALSALGPDYVAQLREGLDPRHGWIDVYPSNDKDSGAFSASVYGRHPYVKMNYQDSLDDLSTLAHEYGHAIHSSLAMAHQPYWTHRYVPFLAEIASTCNEALLSDWLVARAASKDEKAGLLAAELESIRQTIYRQTLFSEFERAVHGYVEAGTPVTAALLDDTYRGLVQKYYGPGFSVDANDGMEWAYIPHFYYKYYVYSYATGLSCGIAIAENVKAHGKPAADGYLQMLEGGCAEPPLDLLKKAGVDLTRPDAINAALQRFDRTVTELADLLGVKLDD